MAAFFVEHYGRTNVSNSWRVQWGCWRDLPSIAQSPLARKTLDLLETRFSSFSALRAYSFVDLRKASHTLEIIDDVPLGHSVALASEHPPFMMESLATSDSESRQKRFNAHLGDGWWERVPTTDSRETLYVTHMVRCATCIHDCRCDQNESQHNMAPKT